MVEHLLTGLIKEPWCYSVGLHNSIIVSKFINKTERITVYFLYDDFINQLVKDRREFENNWFSS